MNHYERLKVSPDAPAEVIRAAYRALATQMHPDRTTAEGPVSVQAHEDMVALNNSYLVLSNPAARAAYDASLRRDHDESFAPTQVMMPEGLDIQGFPETRADDRWAASSLSFPHSGDSVLGAPGSRGPGQVSLWMSRRWVMVAMVVGLGMLMLSVATFLWREAEKAKFDRSVAKVPVANPQAASPKVLGQLSNEELLAIMPQVLEGRTPELPKSTTAASEPAPVASAAPVMPVATPVQAPAPARPPAAGPHHLDGGAKALQLSLSPTLSASASPSRGSPRPAASAAAAQR